jgi:hypothetical protein
MQKVRLMTCVLAGALSAFSSSAGAERFPQGLRFELDGVYASIPSQDLDQILTFNGFEDMSALWGGSVGVRQNLTERVAVFLALGYFTNSTNEVEVILTDAQGGLIGPADTQIEVSIMPVSMGVDFRVAGHGPTALGLQVGGSFQHVRLTYRSEPHPGVNSPILEWPFEGNAVGVVAAVSGEWAATSNLVAGIRLGYRLSEEAELAYEDEEAAMVINPSGGFVTLFIAVLPWGG